MDNAAYLHLKNDVKELQEECEEMGLEDVYENYMANIYRHYLNSFTIFHLIATVVHCIVIGQVNVARKHVTFDICVYLCGAVLTALSLRPYLKVKFEKEHRYVKYLVSWITILIMTASDLMITSYHVLRHDIFLRPCYTSYVISVAYLFMPLPGYMHSVILGSVVSGLYAINFFYIMFINEQNRNGLDMEMDLLVPDILFIFGLNLVCVFLRYCREFVTRSIFLTKRKSLEQTLLWQYAKDQEKNLLIRIIPEQIAAYIGKEIRTRIQNETSFKRRKERNFVSNAIPFLNYYRQFYVEPHDDVSILFADVVNYTQLTTKLDVNTLVDTLHELFKRFDAACKKYSVTRIKFLGDCYYAVSGMPISHPLHAVCCTELGLATIAHIHEVRATHDLEIDMRIGIHSGNVLAGIIGSYKWQYDVWSKDVDIANHLEMTGESGRVHISNTTLNLLDNYYVYEEGTQSAKTDRVLLKNKITSYLIVQQSDKMINSLEWKNYLENKKESQEIEERGDVQKAVVYSEIVEMTNDLMRKETKNLPICKHNWITSFFERPRRLQGDQREEYKAGQCISKYLLVFNNWKWEYHQIAYAPTNCMQYSSSLTLLVLLLIVGIQSVNKIIQELVNYLIITGSILLYHVLVFIMLWRHQIFRKCCRSYPLKALLKRYEGYSQKSPLKAFIFYCTLYTTTLTTILTCSLVHLLICDNTALENDINNIFKLLEQGIRTICFNAWAVSDSMILYMIVALSWPHIPYTFKLLHTLPIVTVYFVLIYTEMSLEFESSAITNVGVTAEFSHIWIVVITLFIHLLICRHLTYLRKYNYISRRQLRSKIKFFQITNESITVLLHNVLPAHVVRVYLDKQEQTRPLNERHNNVAILFATVIHNNEDTMVLPFMNDIICDFDEVLAFYREPINVEKIKVINWTYMAACGFAGSKEMSFERTKSPRSSIFLPNKKRSTSILHETIRPFRKRSSDMRRMESLGKLSEKLSSEDVDADGDDALALKRRNRRMIIHVMASFAVDLLKVIESINRRMQEKHKLEEPPFQLRIGVSYGDVMAGIIGSSHPHYDIWGNAVNMASRMDTTGVPNKIHITENVAEILRTFDIECSFRGMTFVKGVGRIPTYFIETDEDLDFQYSRN